MKRLISVLLAKLRPTIVFVSSLDLQKRAIDNFSLEPSTRRKD